MLEDFLRIVDTRQDQFFARSVRGGKNHQFSHPTVEDTVEKRDDKPDIVNVNEFLRVADSCEKPSI